MKSRILLVLCLLFGALFSVRAAAVSSEIIGAQPGTQAHDDKGLDETKGENHDAETGSDTESQSDTQTETQIGLQTDSADQCIRGTVYEAIVKEKTRNKALDAKLKDREAALKALEETLKIQLAGIEDANTKLDAKIEQMKSIANEDITHLVKMYETMKPKVAGEIFNSMDPAFAAGFLRQMDSNTAGLIMANMNAKKSYTISVLIAGKNANYRK